MNKKASANKVIVFSIIILVIILIIVVSFFLTSKKSETSISVGGQEGTTTLSTECDALEEGVEKWRCYDDLAEEERSLEICDKISKGNYKDACYYGVARIKNDVNICYQITGSETSEIQKDICIRELEEFKTQKCEIEQYPEHQANCLKMVAIANDDLTMCEEIEIQSYKDSCIRHITLNLQEK